MTGPVNLYDVNLGLSWEIDLWGRVRRFAHGPILAGPARPTSTP